MCSLELMEDTKSIKAPSVDEVIIYKKCLKTLKDRANTFKFSVLSHLP